LIGKEAAAISEALGTDVTFTVSGSLENAVKAAAEQAQSGDLVLLSPACASFDQFKDYVARAHAFAHEVEELGMRFEGVQA